MPTAVMKTFCPISSFSWPSFISRKSKKLSLTYLGIEFKITECSVRA